VCRTSQSTAEGTLQVGVRFQTHASAHAGVSYAHIKTSLQIVQGLHAAAATPTSASEANTAHLQGKAAACAAATSAWLEQSGQPPTREELKVSGKDLAFAGSKCVDLGLAAGDQFAQWQLGTLHMDPFSLQLAVNKAVDAALAEGTLKGAEDILAHKAQTLACLVYMAKLAADGATLRAGAHGRPMSAGFGLDSPV
jgi:hypothetical protein